ncbi:hypothetical protein [Symmachiella macrocystis]|uniref:hypothetical protein n=1 Tax=Symmachiella macrocystis TaxID=2527985 RepID=UPI0011B41403|nr:hypothetical protein [Symmachiella macrocystis]
MQKTAGENTVSPAVVKRLADFELASKTEHRRAIVAGLIATCSLLIVAAAVVPIVRVDVLAIVAAVARPATSLPAAYFPRCPHHMASHIQTSL